MATNNQNQDLGLGDKVVQENKTRFINKDGSFNVYRKGVFDRGSFSVYHSVLNASWWRFNLGLLGYYIVINFIFTILYLASGSGAFPDIAHLSLSERFAQLFFYSIQVISTLGSSPLHPVTTMADVFLAIESLIGLLGFALAASLLFARFSNPAVKILFSEQAVIAPYKDMTGFMSRIINGRSNELINVAAVVTVALTDASGKRSIHRLALERDDVQVFPLNWTIVHPIDESSPLFGKNQEDLKNADAEFFVNITAIDQDLSKIVYSRMSYQYDEVLLGAKFANIIEHDEEGRTVVDPKRISELDSR
jgi:inward rectifier potassium channel